MKEKNNPLIMSLRVYNDSYVNGGLCLIPHPGTSILEYIHKYGCTNIGNKVKVRAHFSLSVDLSVIFLFTTCDSN